MRYYVQLFWHKSQCDRQTDGQMDKAVKLPKYTSILRLHSVVYSYNEN